ncbi:hypothetical protein [Winogradskya consettensis]|nr:hypothetical protein [Actinoplanes consettensis]
MPQLSGQVRDAWSSLARTEYDDLVTFDRPYDVFGSATVELQQEIAQLRYALEATLEEMYENVDLIGDALVTTADSYQNVDTGAYEMFDKMRLPADEKFPQ